MLHLKHVVFPDDCSKLYTLFHESLFPIEQKVVDDIKVNEYEIDSHENNVE